MKKILEFFKQFYLKSSAWFIKRSFNELYLTLTFINLAFTFYTYKINKKPEPCPYIVVNLDNTLFISQNWGNIAFNQNILISNYGNEMGTIYSIQAKVESLNQGNKFSLDVLAQNTYDNGQGYKLLPINLGSKGWIQNQYSLYKELPDEEIDRINRWLDTIANEQRSKTYDYNISLKTKKSILNYVDSRIEPFKKGDYVYLISCRNAQNEVLFYQCFTFTISDTNVWQLKHFTDNIINPLSSNKQVIMIHLKVPSEKTYKYIVKKYLDIDY